ncbi:MAG: formate dehydrogenase accessory sulfurtransferase FdhD, partial [Cyanobacteria bacterium J06649_11]
MLCYFVSQKFYLATMKEAEQYESNPQVGERIIRKYRLDDDYRSSKDAIAQEAPLQISIKQGHQQRRVSITMRTPGDDSALALGFLLSEGILPPTHDPNQWKIEHQDIGANHLCLELPVDLKIDWQRLSRQTYTSSSCGVCGKTSIEQVYTTIPWPDASSNFRVSKNLITTLPDLLRKNQPMFGVTGANHGCALFDL